MPGLSDVLGALSTNIADIETNKQKLNTVYDAMNSKLIEQSALQAAGTVTTSKGVRTTPEAFMQESLADKAVQDANRRRAETVDFENFSNQQLDIIKTQSERAQGALDEADRINNGGILDQVVGMFTMPYVAENYRNATAKKSEATSALASVNTLAQQSTATTASIQERITDSTIASMKNALNADRLADAAKIDAQNLATNADQIMKLTTMTNMQLDHVVKGYQLQQSEKQMAALQEERAFRRSILNEQMRKDRNTDQAFALINLAAKANGKNEFPAELKDIMLAKMDKDPQLQALFSQGLQIASNPNREFVQGATPAEALEFRSSINYVPTSKEEQHTISIVNGLISSKVVQDEKTAAGRANKYNEIVRAKLEQDQSNINGATDSLTRPVSWATMGLSSALTETKAWKDVIGPSITDNISANSAEPEDVFNRLVAGMAAGKIKINDATDFYTKYAGYSIEMNNRAFNLEKLTGLKQEKFIAKLPQPAAGLMNWAAKSTDAVINAWINPITGVVGTRDVSNVASFVPASKQSINALDPVEVNNAFAKQIAARLRKEIK